MNQIRTNSYLGQPMAIGGLTAKNRFVVQPMECCDAQDGGFTASTHSNDTIIMPKVVQVL